MFKSKEEMTNDTILTMLSMDGRAPIDPIGKRIKLTKHPTFRRIKELEGKFGIKYLAEIDAEKLGFLKFLVFVKFLDKLPSNDEILAAIKNEPRIQFAATLTGGEYNLMLYLLVENNTEINTIRRTLVVNSQLINYRSEFYITPFYETYNFIPLKPEFIDLLKYEKHDMDSVNTLVPSDKTTDKKKQILAREFATLKELIVNGYIAFSAIDKKYAFDKGRSQYSYYKPKQSGIIKRITISMQKLPIKYVALISLKVVYPKLYYKNIKRLLNTIIKNTNSYINSFALVGDIGLPVGVIFLLPVFDEDNLERVVKRLSSLTGATVSTSIITKTLSGTLCYRKFDNTESMQYKSIRNKS
jgi:DNA-binding Lrp family transcriptional regulator